MSMQSPTDSEAFYEFLGQTLSHGDRETPPESLLRKWRAQREYQETVEAIREGFAQMEAVHNAGHDYRHSMAFPCH